MSRVFGNRSRRSWTRKLRSCETLSLLYMLGSTGASPGTLFHWLQLFSQQYYGRMMGPRG